MYVKILSYTKFYKRTCHLYSLIKAQWILSNKSCLQLKDKEIT